MLRVLFWLLLAAKLGSSQAQRVCPRLAKVNSTTFHNTTLVCLRFWSSGAPIRVPEDSSTVKLGQMAFTFDSNTAQFVDRHGTAYPVARSAKPPLFAYTATLTWSLIIVTAQLDNNGTVCAFKPVIYVPYTTVMSTMANTQFEGKLFNSPPRPAGANETSWFRWTFSSLITVTGGPTAKYGTFLHGTFDNLFHSVLDSQGNCRPALCADSTFQSAECKYYLNYFGGSADMTLSWDINMHSLEDSALVPIFTANQKQYMVGFIQLYQYLTPRKLLPQRYVFSAHGTPLGIPQNFDGTLKKSRAVIERC